MDHYPSETALAVLEFHRSFGCGIDLDPTEDVRDARMTLIAEEFLEVSDELRPEVWTDERHERWYADPIGQKAKLAKELADLVIVVYGTAIALGIDLDKAVQIVHHSNMSKIWPDETVHTREDGKILKPPDYIAPDMTDAVL